VSMAMRKSCGRVRRCSGRRSGPGTAHDLSHDEMTSTVSSPQMEGEVTTHVKRGGHHRQRAHVNTAMRLAQDLRQAWTHVTKLRPAGRSELSCGVLSAAGQLGRAFHGPGLRCQFGWATPPTIVLGEGLGRSCCPHLDVGSGITVALKQNSGSNWAWQY
jgi:hypothetical protein